MNEIDAVTTSGTLRIAGTATAPGSAAGAELPLLGRLFVQPNFRLLLALLAGTLILDAIALCSLDLTLTGLDRVVLMTPVAGTVALAHRLSLKPASSSKRLWGKVSVSIFCLCLLTVISLAAVVLQDAAIAARFSLVDERLAQIDAALGFHWPSAYLWLKAHPRTFEVLSLCYQFHGLQATMIPVLLACAYRMDDLADYLLLFGATVVLAVLISMTIPASNPHIYFRLVRAYDASEWSQFATLRDGTQRVINLSDNQGLISLPSLHAAHAVVFVYVTRHLRGWNVGFAVVNVVMTIAAVPCGGHYLVDILAGIALALVVIWALRRMSLRRNLALHPS